MAGTLTVQNIEGPSSGSNANKVIIPSGQTLDVSGATLHKSGSNCTGCAIFKIGSSSSDNLGRVDVTSTTFSDILAKV